MHAYRRFIQEQMDARGWKQADLARQAGLQRQTVSKIMSDTRDRMDRMPDQATIAALSKAFRIPESSLLAVVGEALGIPVSVERVRLDDVPNEDLIRELQRRLNEAGDGSARSAAPMNGPAGVTRLRPNDDTATDEELERRAALRQPSEGVRQWEAARSRGEESQDPEA